TSWPRDWSSDVCSSDLVGRVFEAHHSARSLPPLIGRNPRFDRASSRPTGAPGAFTGSGGPRRLGPPYVSAEFIRARSPWTIPAQDRKSTRLNSSHVAIS